MKILRLFSKKNLNLPEFEEQMEFIDLIKDEGKKGHKIYVEINGKDCFHKQTIDEFYSLCAKHNIPLVYGSDVHKDQHEYSKRYKTSKKYIEKHGFNVNSVIKK